jgi:hypothetical protein
MEDGIPDPEIEAAIAKLLARRRGGAELPIRDVDAKAAAPVSLLLARVSEYAAYGILAPVIQELIVAPHATIGTSVIDAAAASGEIATAAEDATTLTASGVVGTEVSTDAAGHIDGKTTGWRRASRDEIRAALEDLNVQYKATGERPANQKERRRRIGEQLRSKSLTMDAKVFAGLDKLIFAGALPRGRPPKAKPPG